MLAYLTDGIARQVYLTICGYLMRALQLLNQAGHKSKIWPLTFGLLSVTSNSRHNQ
jgi:hypothetical protein